jgi:hypothetical protein
MKASFVVLLITLVSSCSGVINPYSNLKGEWVIKEAYMVKSKEKLNFEGQTLVFLDNRKLELHTGTEVLKGTYLIYSDNDENGSSTSYLQMRIKDKANDVNFRWNSPDFRGSKIEFINWEDLKRQCIILEKKETK